MWARILRGAASGVGTAEGGERFWGVAKRLLGAVGDDGQGVTEELANWIGRWRHARLLDRRKRGRKGFFTTECAGAPQSANPRFNEKQLRQREHVSAWRCRRERSR
jgi:hypothetical protein